MLNESAFFNRATPFVQWIEGFEPYRNGFAGESACLSTLIGAFHRNHKVAYLCDASASHALDDIPADEIHRASRTRS
jgi:hypothetical protein